MPAKQSRASGARPPVCLNRNDLNTLIVAQNAKRRGLPTPLKNRENAGAQANPRQQTPLPQVLTTPTRAASSMEYTRNLRATIMTPTRSSSQTSHRPTRSRPLPSSLQSNQAVEIDDLGTVPHAQIPYYKFTEQMEGPIPTEEQMHAAVSFAPFAASPRAFTYPPKWTGLPLYQNHLTKKKEKLEIDIQTKMWKQMESAEKQKAREALVQQRMEDQANWEATQQEKKVQAVHEKKQDLANLMNKTNFYQSAAETERVKIIEKKAKERLERQQEVECKRKNDALMKNVMANQEKFIRDINDKFFYYENTKLQLLEKSKKIAEWKRTTTQLELAKQHFRQENRNSQVEKKQQKEMCELSVAIDDLEKRERKQKRLAYGAELREAMEYNRKTKLKEQYLEQAEIARETAIRQKAHYLYADAPDGRSPTKTRPDGAMVQEHATQTRAMR